MRGRRARPYLGRRPLGRAPHGRGDRPALGARDQGLTLAHFRAQLEHNLRTFANTSLTLDLNLSMFGTHSRVNLGYTGDKVSSSLAEMGKGSSS